MTDRRAERRLAAILAADLVGFSRMMRADETGTLARLNAIRGEVIEPGIAAHGGRMVKNTGDGAIVEFPSAVDAVQFAVAMQAELAERNATAAGETRMDFRIGINVGDVIVEAGDLFGDGVNLAARLEGIADPGGVLLSASTHEQVRKKLDLAFEDLGTRALKNIDEPVHVYRVIAQDAPRAAAATADADDRPSIAVLPFDNMSGDPDQAFFADGLVEDLLTTLSKLSGPRVIARNSSFVYKGQAVDVREVARQLGVRHVLQGSVRRGGNRIRITAQLIDATDGSHLWAGRYDRSVDDIFAVQDEITLALATEMQVRLTEGEQARTRYATTSNFDAWTHWVEGLHHFRKPVTRENLFRARDCWEKALALDPGSATLHAMIGFVYYGDARFGWRDDRATALAGAMTHVERALELDPDCHDAFTSRSLCRMLEHRHDAAVADARRAVALAPNSADAAAFACFVLASAGRPEEGLAEIEKAIRLSPHHPPYYLGHLGNCNRLAGRTDAAIAAFKAVHARSPGFGLADLVITYGRSGRPDKARETAAELLGLRRDFTVKGWLATQFRADAADLAADAEALRAAGVPER